MIHKSTHIIHWAIDLKYILFVSLKSYRIEKRNFISNQHYAIKKINKVRKWVPDLTKKKPTPRDGINISMSHYSVYQKWQKCNTNDGNTAQFEKENDANS